MEVGQDIYLHDNFTLVEIANLMEYGGNLDVQSLASDSVCPSNFHSTGNQFICQGDVMNLTDAGQSNTANKVIVQGEDLFNLSLSAELLDNKKE